MQTRLARWLAGCAKSNVALELEMRVGAKAAGIFPSPLFSTLLSKKLDQRLRESRFDRKIPLIDCRGTVNSIPALFRFDESASDLGLAFSLTRIFGK